MLYMGRVVAIHADSHSVDIVSMQDGRRFSGVQVMAFMAGGNVGNVDLPEPTITDAKKRYESGNTNDRDMYCVFSMVYGGFPVVLGFLYPEVAQCNFAAKNFRINRHASDVYSTLDGDGNFELFHPSGTYVRVSELIDNAIEHVDLTQKDVDKTWKITKNKTRHPNIKIVVSNDIGDVDLKTTILLDKDGNVSITNVGNVTVTNGGNVTVTNGGNTNVQTTGTMTLHSTGDALLKSDGKVTIEADDVQITSGTLKHNAKSISDTHTHSGVQTGSGNTSVPN